MLQRQIKENEMDGACNIYGGEVHRDIVGKIEEKRPLGRLRRR